MVYALTTGYRTLSHYKGVITGHVQPKKAWMANPVRAFYTEEEASLYADKYLVPGKCPVIVSDSKICAEIEYFCYRIYEAEIDDDGKIICDDYFDEYNTLFEDYPIVRWAFYDAANSYKEGNPKKLSDNLAFELRKLKNVDVDGRTCMCFKCHNDYYGDFSVVKCADATIFGLQSNAKENVFIPYFLYRLEWDRNTPEDKFVEDIKTGMWWNSSCATTNKDKLFIKLVERSVNEFSVPL